jgi:hypothetical protein
MRAPIRQLMTWVLALVVIGRGLAWGATGDPAVEPVFRVNAGGPALDGGAWAADDSPEVSALTDEERTRIASTDHAIDMSHPSLPAGTPAALFSTQRWDPRERPRMAWRFRVEPGRYEVRLYFAEISPDAQGVGLRTFDVAIEGSVLLREYDVFRAAGGGYRGVMESFAVDSDERLRIAFRHQRGMPVVNGIEVLPFGSTPVPTEEPSPTEEPVPTEEPSGTPGDSSCGGVDVAAGANLQAAADANPTGATFCLHGTYRLSQPVKPKAGQSFVGPAALQGAGSTSAFDLNNGTSGVAGVSFVNLDVSGFTERGIDCWVGTSVIGGRYHHNDRNGIGCGLDYERGQILIVGVEIDHNGSEDDLGQGSGGVKIARLGPDGLTVRYSNIHDNLGSGVWCDVQCIGTFLVEDNLIERNSRKGVHYEKSGATDEYIEGRVVEGQAVIRRNVVTGNGWEGREYAADGGIAGVSSMNMLIEDNVTSGNPRGGIFLRTDGRLSGDKHGWAMEALVRNNQTRDGIRGCVEEPGVTCTGNIL